MLPIVLHEGRIYIKDLSKRSTQDDVLTYKELFKRGILDIM